MNNLDDGSYPLFTSPLIPVSIENFEPRTDMYNFCLLKGKKNTIVGTLRGYNCPYRK